MKTKKIWLIWFGILLLLSAAALLYLGFFGRKAKEAQEEESVVYLHLGAVLEENQRFGPGESAENNRFLDWIREDLNIQIVYDWIYSVDEFQRNINLHIECDELPDALMVNEEQYRQMLEYGQLQPVTDVYRETASDKMKAFVESGGEEMMESVMEDGEMMAVPFPNLTASGINLMWIRQDWLDELDMEVPRTIEEIQQVSAAFAEREMGGEGTIGILGPGISDSLTAVGKCCFGLNPIFSACHAYPKYWFRDEEGALVYGSVQEEAKEALQILADLYQDGVLDQQIFSRMDIQEVLDAGKVGIFFGPWWAAEMLERDITQNKSEWKAYAAPVDEDGAYTVAMPPVVNQYLVIHKRCQNPEAVMEILNYEIENQYEWSNEGKLEGIGIKVYPLEWEIDYADELEYTYQVLRNEMSGKEQELDFSAHKMLEEDLEGLKMMNKEPYDHFGMEDWDGRNMYSFIRLYGILNGVGAIADQDYHPVYQAFSGQTQTMKQKWRKLEALEDETYAQIILGKKPIEAFDEFAEQWRENGGETIAQEIEAFLQKQ